MSNRFLVSVLKFLISLVLLTFIFSAAPFAIEDTVSRTFANIFEYASPDTQKSVVDIFMASCGSSENKSIITGVQLCTNESLRVELEDYCIKYKELKRKNMVVVNEEVEATCEFLEGGEVDEFCNKVREQPPQDSEGIQKACEDFQQGNLNDAEFFVNYMGSSFSNVKVPKFNFFKKYGDIIYYFQTHNILYVIVLMLLFGLVYFLIKDLSLVFVIISRILFNISIFLLLPYLVISAYDYFVGIDTDSLLRSFFEQRDFGANAIISILLIAFLSVYNSSLLTIAVVFLVLGSAGRIYGVILHRKKEPEKEEIKEKKDKEAKSIKKEKKGKEIKEVEVKETKDKKSKEVKSEQINNSKENKNKTIQENKLKDNKKSIIKKSN